ncbi:ribonuclease P protein subunit p30 [Cloeon dipterum]|uniref:ribonuclease P protein subunit p30 n=1 Tax=Cloeon dipterum TaxID=197152 RepID=UPI0032205049
MSVGFCDLNLRPPNKADVRNLCLAAKNVGYSLVAVSTEVDVDVFAKKGKRAAIIPPPMDLTALQKEFEGKLKILQRLTVQISDNLQAYRVSQNSNAMEYDILAVQPLNPQAFQHACSVMEVDMVSFDASDCAPLKAARKVVRQAGERGIYFEAQYSPLIASSATRRNAITLAHALHAVGRGKCNLVLSSGAAASTFLRSPYDVANFSMLLGLSEESAKNCMKQAARTVLLNAQARKIGKGMVFGRLSRPVEDKLAEENGVPPTKKRKADDDNASEVTVIN